MPIYQARCPSCRKAQDFFAMMANRDDTPMCCGVRTQREITPVGVMPDIAPFRSMADGSIINSRSALHSHLKQHDLILGDDLFTDKSKIKPREIEVDEKSIEDSILTAREQLRNV